MENRKLQFAVMRLQFHIAGISNFSKALACEQAFSQLGNLQASKRSLFSAAMLFFIKPKCITKKKKKQE